MAKQNPLVRRHEVAAVVQPLSRGRALRIQLKHLLGDELRVEAVSDEIRTDRGDDEPRGANRIASRERDIAERGSAQHGDTYPDNSTQNPRHPGSSLPRLRRPIVPVSYTH